VIYIEKSITSKITDHGIEHGKETRTTTAVRKAQPSSLLSGGAGNMVWQLGL
jgi:hypothetical protein